MTRGRKRSLIWYFWGVYYDNLPSSFTLGQICTGGIPHVYAGNLQIFLKIKAFAESAEPVSMNSRYVQM